MTTNRSGLSLSTMWFLGPNLGGRPQLLRFGSTHLYWLSHLTSYKQILQENPKPLSDFSHLKISTAGAESNGKGTVECSAGTQGTAAY